MLKLVSSLHTPPQLRKRRKTRDPRRRMLESRIEEDRAIGESTQRAVARGRQSIIETHCSVRRAALQSGCPTDPLADSDRVRLTELLRGLEGIHHRRLLFSTRVELEIDRLDMVRAEIQQLVGDMQTEDKRR